MEMAELQEDVYRLINSFPDRKLIVVGDFLIDEFVFGEISRVSREAPVLILKYQETQVCPGGAANTVANAAALGARVLAVGVIGDDSSGEQLLSLWPPSVDPGAVIRSRRFRTTRKTRILAGSFHSYRQQVVRIDYEDTVKLDRVDEEKLLQSVTDLIPGADAIILSDYSLGSINSTLGKEVIRLGRAAGLPVVVDSRDHPSRYPGATTVTPNITEVENTLEVSIGPDTHQLEAVGFRTLRDWQMEALLVTRGKLGMSLFTADRSVHLPAHGSADAVDVTGAGDTVAATYATALAAGASFEAAARLANIAAGLVVMKKGTASVSMAELEEALRDSGQY
jgi:rfaE bifunctional protein kinase chain/domain